MNLLHSSEGRCEQDQVSHKAYRRRTEGWMFVCWFFTVSPVFHRGVDVSDQQYDAGENREISLVTVEISFQRSNCYCLSTIDKYTRRLKVTGSQGNSWQGHNLYIHASLLSKITSLCLGLFGSSLSLHWQSDSNSRCFWSSVCSSSRRSRLTSSPSSTRLMCTGFTSWRRVCIVGPIWSSSLIYV